jgi:hypothetical protein
VFTNNPARGALDPALSGSDSGELMYLDEDEIGTVVSEASVDSQFAFKSTLGEDFLSLFAGG